MEQLKLFTYEDEINELDIIKLDYVLVKENGRYRLVHSYYNDSRIGQLLTAEQALDAISLCATFNMYSVVAFNDKLLLPRRVK